MKHVYTIPLICLTLAMGCQRPERRGPAPADEVVGTLTETPAVENPLVENPAVETPQGEEQPAVAELPDFQTLTIKGNPAFNGGNNPVKKGCAAFSKMKLDLNRTIDKLAELPPLEADDGVDNPDAQASFDSQTEQYSEEIINQEAAIALMGKSKLVTAKFAVTKARPFEKLFQMRDELVDLRNQQKAVLALAKAGDDFAYEGAVDELSLAIETKSQELQNHLEANTVQISMLVGNENLAQQDSPFFKKDSEPLMARVSPEDLGTSSEMIDLKVDMSYDVVCGVIEATKRSKIENKEELMPSLRMSLKSASK